MRMIFLIVLGGLLISISVRADDDAAANANTSTDTTNLTETVTATNAISDGETNEVLLKDTMLSSDTITNTAGTVLVKISPGLWAGKFEVTQKEYQKVIGGNPSAFHGDSNPVDSVTWSDAMSFCAKLNTMEKDQLPDGFHYSLPTETQWEMLADGASLKDAVMKLSNDKLSSTEPVGSLGANSVGLFDTRGNVMEWCLDSHDPSYHVLRGGAWDTLDEPSSRIEFRAYVQDPTEKKSDYGFRVVLEAGGGIGGQ